MEAKAIIQIQELVKLIRESSKVPLTNKAIIDEDKAYAILGQLEVEYSALIKEKQSILDMKTNILAQAELEAKNIVARAQEEKRALITEAEQKIKNLDIYQEADKMAATRRDELYRAHIAEKERLLKDLEDVKYQTFGYLHSVVNQINSMIPDIKKNMDEINLRLELSEKSLANALEDLGSNI